MADNRRRQRYIKFSVYLTALILINIVGMTLFFRVDLTAGDKYSLSEASRRVVKNIAEPLTIKVFFTRDLPPPHNTTERYLHDLLATYAVHAGSNFNYRYYNVTSGTGEKEERLDANRELAAQYGIYPVQVQSVEEEEIKVRQAYMGLVIIHGDMIEVISPLDSTEGLEYRLTSAIDKLSGKIGAFIKLDEPIDVRLVLSSSLYRVAPLMGIEQLEEVPATVRKIVDELNRRLFGKLTFERVDPADSPEPAASFDNAELLRLQWPPIDRRDGSTVPAGEGTVGLVLSHQEKHLFLPVIEVVDIPLFGSQYSLLDRDRLMSMIDESLETLVGINDRLDYLADHGTLDINPSMMMNRRKQSGEDSLFNFRGLVEKSYSLEPVRLTAEDLSGENGCLVIAGPTEPFSDYDLYLLDQYLMRGNSLALFLDKFQAVSAAPEQSLYSQPRYEPIDTDLEKLLEHYGVRLQQSLVMDESCYRQRGEGFGGGEETAFYFAPLIRPQHINNTPDFMNNIKGLITMKTSPLALDEDRLAANDIAATVLFSSSEKSWEVRENITLNPMFIQPPPENERQSFPLACLLEGKFTSYFADRETPLPPESERTVDGVEEADIDGREANMAATDIEAAGRTVAKGKPAGIFVVGSSRMLGDQLLDSRGRYPNSIFIMNVLDTLNNRDDMALLRSKQQAYNPVDDLSASVKSFIKWFNIAGLPLMVIIAGLLVMLARMAKKRRIRRMFTS